MVIQAKFPGKDSVNVEFLPRKSKDVCQSRPKRHSNQGFGRALIPQSVVCE